MKGGPVLQGRTIYWDSLPIASPEVADAASVADVVVVAVDSESSGSVVACCLQKVPAGSLGHLLAVVAGAGSCRLVPYQTQTKKTCRCGSLDLGKKGFRFHSYHSEGHLIPASTSHLCPSSLLSSSLLYPFRLLDRPPCLALVLDPCPQGSDTSRVLNQNHCAGLMALASKEEVARSWASPALRSSEKQPYSAP